MIFIGVTGGIGSGKSTVCTLFEKKNVPVFYADIVAAKILILNAPVIDEVVSVFGNQVLLNGKSELDRKKLAALAFAEPSKLEKLNSIVHPHVFEEFEIWKNDITTTSRYALAEAALMFESGMDDFVDYVLAVTANDKLRIERATERNLLSKEDVVVRMKSQISTEEVKELSDFVLVNEDSIDALNAKVNFFHALFSSLTSRKEVE